MIELLPRQEIFNLNKTFTSFIVSTQDAIYNPTLEHKRHEPSKTYVEETGEWRFVSQEECNELNEKAYEEYLKKKDTVDTIAINEKYLGQIRYNFEHAELDQYVENFSDGVLELSKRLEWGSVIFLLEYSIPWLHQDNDYPPVKKALEYLRSIGVDENFIGGFKASGLELKELVKNLFWITRCNASLPTCHFSGIDKDFTALFCQYGNIHFNFYSDETLTEIDETAMEMGMIYIEGRCYENFSETGAIDGREILC